MAFKTLPDFAGIKDINNQFNAKNIAYARTCYDEQIANGGTYELGALTACFYKYPAAQKKSWMEEVERFYDKAARDQFKAFIVEALAHQPDPIPFTVVWDKTSSGITRTYDPYTIYIGGNFPPPMESALAERRERKKPE
jgi:hypothetical protein